MKKMIFAAFAALMTVGAQAQGSFQTVKTDGYTLHVYNTGDALGDAAYVVESANGLVILEKPIFDANVKEFDAYVSKLGKKVITYITDYHEGATADNTVIQAQGMGKFMREGAYDVMMKNFQQQFGKAMAARPTGKSVEVKFGDAIQIDGVSYTFNAGPANDFPAADILIGDKVVLMHWAPAKAHMNALQLANAAAVGQTLTALKAAKATGAECFAGGHGGLGNVEAVNFRIAYLEKIQQLIKKNKDAASFAKALKAAYPGLAGEQGVDALAQNLYK